MARPALVITIILMGVAAVVSSGATLAAVEDASLTLERGQADAIEHTIRGALRELGQWPVGEDLAEIVTASAAEGLVYLAVADPTSGQVSRTGRPARPEADPLALSERDETPVVAGDHVRVVFHMLLKRDLPADASAPAHGSRLDVVFELVPIEARQLRAAAARTFRVAAVAAFLLAALALALFQRVLRGEAMALELERAQHLANLGQLSGVLAHEIRNPLASLKGNAQLLAASLPGPADARALANRVVTEAMVLEHFARDLLELARTGRVQPLPRSPAGLLAEAASALPLARVILDVTRAPSSWMLDGERVVQALTGLLELGVQAGQPVRASITVEEGELVFEVRHGPPSVPPVAEPRPSTPGTAETRWLGLCVARGIVELHGGRLDVSDGPPGVSRFRMCLPFREPPASTLS